jgi:SAM-dependent methyltransferase
VSRMATASAAGVEPRPEAGETISASRPCEACASTTTWSCRRLAIELGNPPPVLRWECSGCRAVRMELDASEGEAREYVNAFLAMIERGYETKDLQKALRLFRERACIFAHVPVGKLLDIGSERGYFLRTMHEHGWSVTGIEPHKPFSRYARDVLGMQVFNATLDEAELKDKFDLITMWHVLEHPTHRWMFCTRSLTKVVESAGLVVDDIRPVWTSASWYGLKRGLKGVLTGRDAWQSRIAPSNGRASLWRELLAALVGFYPISAGIAMAGAMAGRGEVLRVWCRARP